MHELKTSTISLEECVTRFEALEHADFSPYDFETVMGSLDETVICTSNVEGVGICNGDNGDPLVSSDSELIGIASWTVGCADGMPDVYTSVYHQLEWINKEMKN